MDESAELPCRDTRNLLALLGAVPCLLRPPYLPSLNPCKSSLVYCVALYSIISYNVMCSAIKEKHLYDETDHSNVHRSIHALHILAMLPHFVGINFWIDVPALLGTLETFQDLQVKFRAATGKRLVNRRRRGERIAILAAFGILIIVSAVVHHISPLEHRFDFFTGVALLYGNVLAICATYLLIGMSWGVYDAADDTKKEFRKQLNFLTPSKVYNFRLLWLSMRTTLDSIDKWHSPALVYSSSMCAVVVFFYESAFMAQMGETVLALSCLISGAFYVGLIRQICTTSHLVQEEMKGLVGQVLPKVALTSYDIKIQREIVMLFLVESARPAATRCRGFIVINKHLILSFFSNISTYIIVLVQFSQKGDSFSM